MSQRHFCRTYAKIEKVTEKIHITGLTRAELEELAATFGELMAADKQAISHRARAFAQFRAACFTSPGSLPPSHR